MQRYAGGDLGEPRTIREEVLTWYGSEECDLTAFQERLAAIAAAIPVELRSTAKVEFESGYDSGSTFKIWYDRPETAEEVEARVSRALDWARTEEKNELAQFRRLKAKFEAK